MKAQHLRSIIAISIGMLLTMFAGAARADRVDRLVSRLSTSKAYKVRLSAALNLSKSRDKRAIPAFVKALRDSDKTVRGVAAVALGKLVGQGSSKSERKRVLSALNRAAKRDDSSFVRKQAQKAWNKVKSNAGGGGGGSLAGATAFVDIGPMSDKSGGGKSLRTLMRDTASGAFRKKDRSMKVDWPGRKKPTVRQLRRMGVPGFHVDGTINKLAAVDRGGRTTVSCKISMIIATYPRMRIFGTLSGRAKITTGSSDRQVLKTKSRCVSAVVQDLISRKIIPTIKSQLD